MSKEYRISDEGTPRHPAFAVREKEYVGYTGLVWKLRSYHPTLEEAVSHVHMLGGKLVSSSLTLDGVED